MNRRLTALLLASMSIGPGGTALADGIVASVTEAPLCPSAVVARKDEASVLAILLVNDELEAEPLLAAPEINVGMPALSIGHPYAGPLLISPFQMQCRAIAFTG